MIINGTDAREVGRIDLGPALFDADASDPDTVTNVFRQSTQIRSTTATRRRRRSTSRACRDHGLVNLKGGNDTLAIRGLNLPLTLDPGDGDDLVLAGSHALEREGSNEGGTLDLFLVAPDAPGRRRARHAARRRQRRHCNNTGTLTATLLTGLDTQDIDYLAFEDFALDLGSGNDTLTVTSTVAGPNTFTTGAGNDTVNAAHARRRDQARPRDRRRYRAGRLAHQPPQRHRVHAGDHRRRRPRRALPDRRGDTAANTGRLTVHTLTGLGLGGTLTYLGFEAFELLLGSGADTLFVDSTHAGTTRDRPRRRRRPRRHRDDRRPDPDRGRRGHGHVPRQPGPRRGQRPRRQADARRRARRRHLQLSTSGASATRSSTSPTAARAPANALNLNGTELADQFLLRRDLVALLNAGVLAGRADRVRQRDRDAVHRRLGGDDRFALDDNSSVTTIEGGEGNDLFQVGQLFGSIISTEPPATIDTTRGKLTNGISFATTIKRRGRQRHVRRLQQPGRARPRTAATTTTRSSCARSAPARRSAAAAARTSSTTRQRAAERSTAAPAPTA